MDYLKIIKDELLPFADNNLPVTWTYQQENCPIHVNNASLQWLSTYRIRPMKFQSRSPHLNPIENKWGWIVRKAYEVCRQFDTVWQLSQCFRDEWENARHSFIYSPIFRKYIQKWRSVYVLETNGGKIHYLKLELVNVSVL